MMEQVGHHAIKLWLALPKPGLLRNVIHASAHTAKKAIGVFRKPTQSCSYNLSPSALTRLRRLDAIANRNA